MSKGTAFDPQQLPQVLVGPILRKVTTTEVNLFLVTSTPVQIEPTFSLQPDLSPPLKFDLVQQSIRFSDCAYAHMVTAKPIAQALPNEQLIYYDIALKSKAGNGCKQLKELIPDWLYPGQQAAHFFLPKQVNTLFFGSCRNPHHPSIDSLVIADDYIAANIDDLSQRPSVLLHGGDQVYVDDVAGPTLKAIHSLADILGLADETLPDSAIGAASKLYDCANTFYNRQSILPKVSYSGSRLFYRLAPFRRTFPVFSSVKIENHLISLAEMLGLYLLNWSPECWHLTAPKFTTMPDGLTRKQTLKYQYELASLETFIAGLSQVRRMLAHIPNYMIFDDHDVTDDWNLTAQWEQNVYSNPLSKRVISNALLGYWIFQGWGNAPEQFEPEWVELVEQVVSSDQPEKAELLEQQLLEYDHWHYTIELEPHIVVLDTRTHRWRSERSLKNPSGLLDWDHLVELEQELVDQPACIIVSPAPIFGVKLIETIQRVFSFFGHELMVDAENWMAHPGSAKKLLQIFRRLDTPSEIIVLSGDVHYSFCFAVKQRFQETSTQIWQLTSSGFKNEFPLPLIKTFDFLERMLYFAASPFNVFTKRRSLEIEQIPLMQQKKQILLSKSNIGLLQLEDKRLKHFKVLIDKNQLKQFL